MYRVLAYHRIAESADGALCVAADEFVEHLARLRRWNFTILTLADFEAHRVRKAKGRFAALTFDDGYLDNFTVARQIIDSAGGRATFFVPSGLLGTGEHMTWEQVKELADTGFEIGSHTKTHRELPGLDSETLQDEIAGSREELQERLGTRIESFAYPRGLYDHRAKAAVRQAGYSRAVVTPRASGHQADRFTIERVGIYGHTGPTEFTLKVLGIYSQIKKTSLGARVSAARDARRTSSERQ